MIIGFPGNLGDLVVSIVTAGRRYRLTNSRLIRSLRPRLAGTNIWDDNDGIAKRRKRSAARSAARSRSVSQYR
jgi:hypothetical protein